MIVDIRMLNGSIVGGTLSTYHHNGDSILRLKIVNIKNPIDINDKTRALLAKIITGIKEHSRAITLKEESVDGRLF